MGPIKFPSKPYKKHKAVFIQRTHVVIERGLEPLMIGQGLPENKSGHSPKDHQGSWIYGTTSEHL